MSRWLCKFFRNFTKGDQCTSTEIRFILICPKVTNHERRAGDDWLSQEFPIHFGNSQFVFCFKRRGAFIRWLTVEWEVGFQACSSPVSKRIKAKSSFFKQISSSQALVSPRTQSPWRVCYVWVCVGSSAKLGETQKVKQNFPGDNQVQLGLFCHFKSCHSFWGYFMLLNFMLFNQFFDRQSKQNLIQNHF